MSNKRTIITLSESNKTWLEAYSSAHGISMAEAIRRGISRLKQDEHSALYQQLLEKTRGKWRQGDGLAYQQSMREERERIHD